MAEQLELEFNPPSSQLKQLWTPEDIYRAVSAEVIHAFKEDRRVERKPCGLAPRALGDYLSMYANTQPHGGVVFIGVEKAGYLPWMREKNTDALGSCVCHPRICRTASCGLPWADRPPLTTPSTHPARPFEPWPRTWLQWTSWPLTRLVDQRPDQIDPARQPPAHELPVHPLDSSKIEPDHHRLPTSVSRSRRTTSPPGRHRRSRFARPDRRTLHRLGRLADHRSHHRLSLRRRHAPRNTAMRHPHHVQI